MTTIEHTPARLLSFLFKQKNPLEPCRDEPTRLFVHIPKTAGTSFRTAVESRFGRSRVLRDYGLDSDATSKSIREEIYQKKNCPNLERAIQKRDAVLVSGHVPISKYGRQIGLKNTIVLFRDPVQQVISHYRHAVRDKVFRGDLISFAKLDRSRNVQTRFMAETDPALVGIIGLTERYRESLTIAEHRWGWNLKHRRRNVSGRLPFRRFEVSDVDLSELEHLNRSDRRLYERACQLFDNSWSCLERGIAADPRGAFTDADIETGISGWAFDMYSDTPLKVELLVNGVLRSEVRCNLPVQEPRHWKTSGKDHIGFRSEMDNVAAGDAIEIRDTCSGLTLATAIASCKRSHSGPG